MPVETKAQVMQFINEVYLYDEPANHEIYHRRLTSTKDIYNTISECYIVFEKRTSQSFATWCKNRRLPFLNGKEFRQNGTRVRDLYIMENVYYGNSEKQNREKQA